MNILIPDSWLREYLKTKATPKQIKEYLSLCGPSVERIHEVDKDYIYDVEITTNRPDSMSAFGMAREAAAILPRFGIGATQVNDPYAIDTSKILKKYAKEGHKKLIIRTDPVLNPRWTSIVFENVTIKKSPSWLTKKLEQTGIRSLNNVIDITNYLMRAYGQPAHAFDFDSIKDSDHLATMKLRASKKGEKLITLDGKTHTLPGDDIVIVDGKGRLIDLCGVMGAQNSSITQKTQTVILFLQTYDPVHIRKTMMALSHRTEAGSLFEKGTDSQLVLPAFVKAVEYMSELTGGTPASKLYDIYPKPYAPYPVTAKREKIDAYIGTRLTDNQSKEILTSLGFKTTVSPSTVTVTVPSFRKDVVIDVDVIEELARLFGYHNITSTLPNTAPPNAIDNKTLKWEEEIKIRLRDWGYTETYTYSMISAELMDIFGLDKTKAYKITNPLSSEWVYMRPTLTPSLVMVLKNNVHLKEEAQYFELSMIYRFRQNDLPQEEPCLMVMWKGDKFLEAKGLTEALFSLLGIPFPTPDGESSHLTWYTDKSLQLGSYGALGVMDPSVLRKAGINEPVTRLYLDISKLVSNAKPIKQYHPPSRYPAVYEDFTFIFPPQTPIGPVIQGLTSCDPLIDDVSLGDSYEDTRTLHITYLSREKNLTSDDIVPIRQKLLEVAKKQYNLRLKV